MVERNMEREILNYSIAKGPISINYCINKDTVIIDFYNVYCNYIKFDTFKTFSLQTFKNCLDNICNVIKNKNLLIVSKNIFEVPNDVILQYTKKYKHLSYFMIEDTPVFKTQNRERDDFMCLVLNRKLEKSFIVSNDKFSNIKHIINNVKPFKVTLFKKNEYTVTGLSLELLNNLKKLLLNDNFNPTRKKFTFPVKK
jgi:hypothetical protein